MVDRVWPVETWGETKHGKSRECKTRKEVEEDRETTDLSAMLKLSAHRLIVIARNSNDLESFGFHGSKLSKGRGRGASSEERAVLHQSVDESLAGGLEFTCAKEALCMTEDAQSAAGFGGQL